MGNFKLFGHSNKNKSEQKEEISANTFLNIRTVQDGKIYTIDNKILGILRIYPKNCNLMSQDERKAHARVLTSNMATELKPFKLYFANRPVDLQRNQDYQAMLMDNEANSTKFYLLNQRMKSFGMLSATGKAQESEIYLIIWETKLDDHSAVEIDKRLNEMKRNLSNATYKTEILNDKQIIQVINGFTNPVTAYLEDQNYMDNIVQVK